MKRKSVEVTIIFGITTLIHLLSQIIVVRLFGASFEYDAFLVAVALPTVIVTVIYSTLNDAFMPLYANNEGDSNKKMFASQTIISLFIVGLIFSSLAYFLVRLLQPIFITVYNPDLFLASVPLFKSMIWVTPFAIVATIIGSTWYYQKKYIRFPLAQLFGATISILTTFFLYKTIGIWALVIGFLINIISQYLIIFPNSKISYYSPNFYLTIPLLVSWLPLIISSFSVRSDTLIMRSFASQVGEGHLVYINLVSRMYSLGSGIVTIGIQVLLLPTLLERFAQKKYQDAFSLVNKTKVVGIILSIISSFGILFIGPILIKYLFVGGKFTLYDLEQIKPLFYIFLVPSFGWGLNSIFYQPLIALKKIWSLAFINSFSFGFAWITTRYLFNIGLADWAISIGLCVLLFGSIIISEIVWQTEKKKILRLVYL